MQDESGWQVLQQKQLSPLQRVASVMYSPGALQLFLSLHLPGSPSSTERHLSVCTHFVTRSQQTQLSMFRQRPLSLFLYPVGHPVFTLKHVPLLSSQDFSGLHVLQQKQPSSMQTPLTRTMYSSSELQSASFFSHLPGSFPEVQVVGWEHCPFTQQVQSSLLQDPHSLRTSPRAQPVLVRKQVPLTAEHRASGVHVL